MIIMMKKPCSPCKGMNWCAICWQVSCIPADCTVPEWAMGATMYQIFPDRFRKAGKAEKPPDEWADKQQKIF